MPLLAHPHDSGVKTVTNHETVVKLGMTRTCSHCGADLGFKNAQAEFCSGKCRVAAHRARKSLAVPATMAGMHRWIRWIRDGKQKRPFAVGGYPASVTNPAHWSSMAVARASRQGDGIGFVLAGDGIGCIDLDDCVSAGVVADWAQEILALNPATFTELSESGTGIHIWGLRDAGPGCRIRDGRNLEFYSTGRYIALGSRYRGSPLRLEPLIIP
ncbi:DNA primase [Paeniglutamicibacter terrestris]|uniref:DNA primase n=1 Tax=Paeniglutamicibacter terrestris TaxID=2723403 RepID=A0ABX1G6D9_9MICC|nr:DNA primase [Paeniglutamicibacter terrestris]NKG21095.1 DNA primase [Paeniglutamicibacter terrestris]